MSLPKYVRVKTAKGKTYYYFDAGKGQDGKIDLIRLPHIKDPRFGDCLARAKATRTSRKNRQGVLTLDGLIQSYEKSPEFRGLKQSSQYSYSMYLARASRMLFSPSRGSPPVKSLERKDVLTLREQMADTPGAANQIIRAIGALFAWAVDNEKVKENIAAGVKKYPAKPHKPWSKDLLEEALTDPQVGMPVALLFFTGQRIDDVVAMQWNRIQGDHMLVYVKKKDKDIRVAILPELAEKLAEQEKTAVTILTNANGKPWTKDGLRIKLQAWAGERGHKVVPHGLRKNAVEALLLAGCTTAEVSGITDQSIQMIEHYAKDIDKLGLGLAAVVKLDAHRRARNKAGK